MIDELSKLVPLLEDARTIRSYWGVRPLYEPPDTGTTDPTDISRQFFLLDHAERDGLEGMMSIVGGKFTTYRLMAEKISNHVCEQLGVERKCTTAEEPLPGSEDFAVLRDYMDEFGLRSPIVKRSVQRLGSKADEVLKTGERNPVVCTCEAVTSAELRDAISHAGMDLNATRIRTRASMGNCQGGFCCHRMAHELSPEYDEEVVRESLDELYQERWKGQRHALWGEQLSQAMLNHALHATTMNRDRDPAREDEGEIEYGAFDAGPSPGVSGDGSTRATADGGLKIDGGAPDSENGRYRTGEEREGGERGD